MKKNISINLQGIIFHIEDDGYDVLSRYLQEVKAHFASYQGHEEIVADIEGRIAELFAARISPAKQVITLADVQQMTAKMGRVSDFNTSPDDDEEPATASSAAGGSFGPNGPFGPKGPFGSEGPFGPKGPFGSEGPFGPKGPFATGHATTADGQPRRLYRDLAHRKIAGVCAGLAQYLLVNPLLVRLAFLAALLLPSFFTFGPFFHGSLRNNAGPSTLAFISYVVLWIALPKRYDAPEPIDTLSSTGPLAGRKLYRNTDAGKVGGVSAGLAAYFNTDVTLIRVLFLLSLFVGGAGFFIYVVLWVVVPEARTVSEKMQMRGDAVTLSGIDSNLRNAETDGPAGPNRPVGTFFENAAREAQPAFSFVGRVLRIVVGGILLLIAGSSLLSLAAALGTTLSIFPPDTVELGDAGTKYALLHDASDWSKVAIFFTIAIPTLSLLLLGLRLILRRPLLSQGGSLLLLGLWLLSVVGTAAAANQFFQNYRTRAIYISTHELKPSASKGLVLAVRDQGGYQNEVRLRVVPADSTAPGSVEEEFSARGRSQSAARLTAQSSILYHYAQQDSTLTLDRGIELKEGTPFRNQQLTLTLHLPLGKTYSLTPEFIELLDEDYFAGHRRPDTNEDHRAPYRARLTRQGRFVCLSCPDDSNSAARDGDEGGDDGDEVVRFDVNGNRTRVRVNTDGDSPRVSVETDMARVNSDPAHYGTGRKTLSDPGEFSEVEVRGALKVVVRAGSEYKVEAAGHPDDLNRIRLSRDGNRVTLRQDGDFNLLNLGDRDHQEVLVTVTLPRLTELVLREASEADVSGFNQQDDLHLEVRNASAVRLQAQVATLSLNLREASRADLSGSAQRLDVEGHSASQLDARQLAARQAEVNLHEASSATVHATETLDVDASSGSQVSYLGNPRVSQDLSSGSSLEQVR